jgi:hypothetical protein
MKKYNPEGGASQKNIDPGELKQIEPRRNTTVFHREYVERNTIEP